MNLRRYAAGAAILCAVAPALLAHHSFAAEFDTKQPVTLMGIVKKVEWTNPHAHLLVDVKEPDGKSSTWDLELGSPNMLLRYHWTRNTLKEGDEVVVDGYRAKDGSKLANVKSVKFPDGRVFSAGSAADSNEAK
jgi:hypothetical protein